LEKPVRIIGEKPNDPKRAVYDYSNLISDDTKLAALEHLCKDLRKGDDNDIYLKTFYTDYRMSSTQLDEILNYTKSLGRNDLVAWVHLENAAGEVTSGLFFGPGLEQRLTKDFLDHTKELLIQSVKVYHKFSSIPVKGLAWVAGGLSKVISLTEISPAYYDPSLGGAYDPTIFLFYYIGQSTAELGSGIIANTIVSDDDDFAEKIGGALLKDLGVKQYEFALVTGFWNGIVEELRGVADATEMLCHAYTDPPTIDQVNEVMHSILNGSAFNA